MRVQELSGAELDYWVERAEGTPADKFGSYPLVGMLVPYSSDWSQGGPIIEREQIGLLMGPGGAWHASYLHPDIDDYQGPTALIAAMRAYVANRFGDKVPEIAEER